MKKLVLASILLASYGVNAQTVKKVVMEDYTGLHCGWCPEGTVILEDLHKNNPTNVIPIAIHTGNYEPAGSTINMQSTVGGALTSSLKVLGFPAGGVDRKRYAVAGYLKDTIAMGRGYWAGAFAVQAAKTAIASVSFSNVVDNGSGSYSCDVNVMFTALPPAGVPVVVQMYIIEDSIAASGALAQDNYSSNVQAGKSPLGPWYHNRTLRYSASGDAWGFTGVVPTTPVVGTKYTKSITFTTGATWVKKNLKMIAYVELNGSAVNDQKEILNAEEMNLGSVFKTGVENVNANVSVQNVYPNPATVNDVIHVEYTIAETANVSMKVYNTMGQLVATPFNSLEVAGTHTMQWKAAEHNLAAGTYIMELSTPNGKQVQRISLQ